MGTPPRPGQLLLIFVVALLDTTSDICLKLGANQTAAVQNPVPWLGTSGLLSPWVWLGVLTLISGFVLWTQILRIVPLGVAYTLSNVVHVTVPISAWLILGEVITPDRWFGIALVVAGLFIVAQPFVRIEQHIEENL